MSVPRKLHGDEGPLPLLSPFSAPNRLLLFPCLSCLPSLVVRICIATGGHDDETDDGDQPCDHPPPPPPPLHPPDKPHITWRIWHGSTNKQKQGARLIYFVQSKALPPDGAVLLELTKRNILGCLVGITQVITNMMFSFYPTVNIQFRGFSLIKICSPDDFIIRAMAT